MPWSRDNSREIIQEAIEIAEKKFRGAINVEKCVIWKRGCFNSAKTDFNELRQYHKVYTFSDNLITIRFVKHKSGSQEIQIWEKNFFGLFKGKLVFHADYEKGEPGAYSDDGLYDVLIWEHLSTKYVNHHFVDRKWENHLHEINPDFRPIKKGE